MPAKICFFAYYTVGIFTSVFKDNKSLNHKAIAIRFCFLTEGSGSRAGSRSRSGSKQIITAPHPHPGGPKIYGSSGFESGTLAE
jgi:hypothetical protein